MINKTKEFIKKRWLLIYSFITAALVLLFCSKSSPLYPMNDWVDVQCFLTLGKGMLNGMVPYVDLYEQKGPVLYFIYAIVALFSNRSMFGQYLLEIITYGLFLYFSAKLAEIYLGNSKKLKINFNGKAYRIRLGIPEIIDLSIKLLSKDNFVLLDKNGVKLIPKEEVDSNV